MRSLFSLRWSSSGSTVGRHEAGRRQRRARLALVREEEEGGRLGREVSWVGREAEAQWGGGGNGRLERKKRGCG